MSLLSRLWSRGRRAADARPKHKTFRPALENLEGRELPSTVAHPHIDPTSDVFAYRMANFPAPLPFTGARNTFETDGNHFALDARGVLMTFEGPIGGYVYLPTNIARYAMSLYDAWRQGDDSALAGLAVNARWLMLNAHLRRADGHAFLVYPLPVSEPAFHIQANRAVSALAAGHAMAALYAAGIALNDAKMLRAAQMILPGFAVTIQNGGYRLQLGPRSTWFEEYAQPSVRPPRVLNGHIWAVFDLHWYAQQTGNALARTFAIQGVNALRQSVAKYTDHPISAYDLERRGQICGYHYADISLLRQMYTMTGIRQFGAYADLWSKETC